MEDIQALVVDLNPICGLGNEIVCLLAKVQHPRISVDYVTSEWQHLTSNNQKLIPDSPCQIVFFVVIPAALLEKPDTLQTILKKVSNGHPVVAVTDVDEPEQLFSLLSFGADDCITPPLRKNDIVVRLWRLLNHRSQSLTLATKIKVKLGLKQLIGNSPAFSLVIDKIPLVARCDANVLISGETGTGKEICARAIHYLSPRQSHPFVPVNCGAIPTELVENELFGHAPGAFTGGDRRAQGLLQEADGGTLFLDEIDSLSLIAQVKLLRMLQDKEYRPLGSTKTLNANVRVIVATNIDCDVAVCSGKLRRDLYYRLNVIRLDLPPLRERRSDIPLLANHFLAKYMMEFQKSGFSLSVEAMRRLQEYDWPGNVRQLENLIERAIVLAEKKVIQCEDLDLPSHGRQSFTGNFQAAKSACVAQFERDYVETLLHLNHGNITKAAQVAEKNRRAFWELIRKHHIDVRQFKLNPPAK